MDKRIVLIIERLLNEFELKDLFLNESICLNVLLKNFYIISETNCECTNSIDSKVVYINQEKWSSINIDINRFSLVEQEEVEYKDKRLFENVKFVGDKFESDMKEYILELRKCITKGKRIQFEHAINVLAFYRDATLYIQVQSLFSGTYLNILSIAQGSMVCTNNGSELCMKLQRKNNDLYKVKGLAKGVYSSLNLVFEKEASSILLHEVVHIFEKDNLRPLLGKKVMCEDITIVDSPYVTGSWANRIYDDFGRKMDDCVLVKSGILINTGSMIKRDLINDEDRKRFMVNTTLLSSRESEESILNEEVNERLIFSQILGAKNDGKNIILSRCRYRHYREGVYSEEYYISKMVLKISDIVKKMIPIGKENCMVNGLCSNQYYVSYSAPILLLKEIGIQVD